MVMAKIARGLSGPFKKLGSKYAAANAKRPIVTKALTSATLFGAGDFVAQKCEAYYSAKKERQLKKQRYEEALRERKANNPSSSSQNSAEKEAEERGWYDSEEFDNSTKTQVYDLMRTLRFCLVGFCLVGPCGHFWFKLLDKLFGSSRAFGSVLKKLCLDQMFYGPSIYAAIFGSLAVMEDKPVEDKLRNVWWPAQQRAWCFWTVGNFLNFMFVPAAFRLAYVGTLGLCYNTFLSAFNKKGGDANKMPEIEEPEPEPEPILATNATALLKETEEVEKQKEEEKEKEKEKEAEPLPAPLLTSSAPAAAPALPALNLHLSPQPNLDALSTPALPMMAVASPSKAYPSAPSLKRRIVPAAPVLAKPDLSSSAATTSVSVN